MPGTFRFTSESKIVMLRTFFLIFFLSGPLLTTAQLITIADARAQPIGSTVTVNGIITSGDEFGTVRYLQDGTGGIALFSTSLSSTLRGDNITVTGVTMDYQSLLEISPVNSWLLTSSSNPLPIPALITPNQLSETFEAQLVQINNVSFANGGAQFQGNASYGFTSNGESGVVYIRSGNPLVGQTIPASSITVYGICSQYGNQYQLLPRDGNDLVNSSAISIITPPYPQNITQSSVDVAWNTDVNGNSFLRYGHTTNLELGTITGPTNTTSPVIGLPVSAPAELFYTQAFSVAGNDTAFATIKSFISASNSTGAIKVYFNRPVDQYVANPTQNTATYLSFTFADTLKAYIDRSMVTLDIAIYSFDSFGTSSIIQAVNDAYNRGVQIRIIVEGGNANAGLQLLNAAIPVLQSPQTPPTYFGIMHNKFFIMDGNDPDATKPVVMTGSTNWSDSQLNDDRNNLVFVQDQSLAKVYTVEFEEMWGGTGAMPNPANSLFGPDKKDNTPHELRIAGKKVECFFSPSDDTNNQILKSIESADNELCFATMVFTRFDLAYGIEERVDLFNVNAYGILNDSSGGSGTSFLIMQGAMGNNLLLFDHGSNPGILHHKYLIADQNNGSSDPLVLTGSHNWSTAANIRNDENIIIIHDAEIANQYYQEFHNLFNGNGGSVSISETGTSQSFSCFPNPSSGETFINVSSDQSAAYSLIVMDVSGKKIHEQKIAVNTGQHHYPVDFSYLPAGMYLLKLDSSNGTAYSKLVIR